jgi:Uma2 family endonuclease
MGTTVEKRRYTVADYLRMEQDSEQKHEYRDGEVLCMAGGTANHSLIIVNILAELRNRLKGKRCRPYDSNLRVGIPRTVLYTYPDVSVFCGDLQPDPTDRSGQTVTNPRVIIEVLSESTEGYDRGEKFNRYRQIDSLEEYVLVAQNEPSIQIFLRQSGGAWLFTPVAGMEAVAKLRSIDVELPLSEVYAGVEFPPPPKPEDEAAPANN